MIRIKTKHITRQAILNKISENGGISKSQLADELNLSKPAVSRNVSDLIAMGLVEERGEGAASRNGGRKPVKLYINGAYKYIVSLDIAQDEPMCAIGDFNLKLLKSSKVAVNRKACIDEKQRAITKTINDMCNELAIKPTDLGMVVLSHPGVVDAEGNALRVGLRHHPWTEANVKKHLTREFGVPVVVENDIYLAAVGVLHFDLDLAFDDCIYVSCGFGLGARTLIKGKAHEGANNAAGEMDMLMHSDGRRIEEVVAMDGLLTYIEQLEHEHNRSTGAWTFDRVVKLSRSGDELVNTAIKHIGGIFGMVLYNYSVAVNVPTIMFGGEYLRLGKVFFDSINEVFARSFSPFKPRVLQSTLNEAASLFGGFAAGREAILRREL